MKYWTPPMGGLYLGKRLKLMPHVTEYALSAPIKIVFLADVHMSRNFPLESVKRLMEAMDALKPDMLLMGGDYVENEADARAFFEQIARVRTVYGSYAVFGNNDDSCFDGDAGAYRALMRDCGVTLLSNEMARVSTRAGDIELAGVEDSYNGAPDAEGLFSTDARAYRILISHAPHSFLLRQTRVAPDIMLCGHTHGGQINFLGLTCYSLIRYEHWFDFTHIAGVKRVGETSVIVSRGVGVSKHAIRFGARPEVLVIH